MRERVRVNEKEKKDTTVNDFKDYMALRMDESQMVSKTGEKLITLKQKRYKY